MASFLNTRVERFLASIMNEIGGERGGEKGQGTKLLYSFLLTSGD